MSGKKLISQSLIYGVASLLINGSNFFLIPFYTHYLSAEEYGITSGVTVFSTTLISIFGLGLNGAVTRFYFDLDANEFKTFLFTIFSFQIGIAFFVISLTSIFDGGAILDGFYRNVPYNPFLKLGLWIGFTGTFSQIPLALFQAKSKALAYRLATSLSFVLLTALMFYFVVFQRAGAIGSVYAALLANSLMALLYTYIVFVNSSLAFKVSHLKAALIFSLPLLIYTVFGTITELASKFFIERYVSISGLGVFNVAQQISAVMLLVSNAINMAWVPIFYERAGKGESNVTFDLFARFLIFLLTSIALGLSLFANDFVKLFMSPGYQAVGEYIPLLALSYVIGNGYWVLLVNPIAYAKKTYYMPFLTLISGAFAIGLNLLIVPRFGIVGATVATFFSYIALVIAAFFVYRKVSDIRYNFWNLNGIVLTGIAIYLISYFVNPENWLWSMVAKTGLFSLFVAGVVLLRLYTWKDLMNFVRARN